MRDNHNMTTIIVHNILTNQRQQQPSVLADNPVITMNYEYDTPTALFNDTVKDRIRARSFYDTHRKYADIKRTRSKNRMLNEKEGHSLSQSQPKVIDLEFESTRSKSRKREGTKTIITTNQYYNLMVQSMQEYIKKVELGKRKKIQKCEKLRSFGVNIQSIKAKPQEDKIYETLSKTMNTPNQYRKFKKPNQISMNQITIQKNDSICSQMSSDKFNKNISVSHHSKKNKFTSKKFNFKAEKKDDDRKIGSKFRRMFDHFSIILSSFGVSLSRSSEEDIRASKKSDKKYTYYIGNGNNKNLIVSILKKRWWWTEAEDIGSANFVWSQLKIASVLQKQTSMIYSDMQEVQPNLYVKTSQQDQRSGSAEQTSQRIFNIFHRHHSHLFHARLPVRNQRTFLRQMKTPAVVHNHYEANYMLGNKKALFYNMTEYKTFKNQGMFEYIPLTFHVEKINSKAFKAFEKKAKERDQKKALWIVKPGENSNRGQGIFVSDSVEAIKNKIEKNKKHSFIIQKYIKNNLTFNRRKFDIRTYVLMVSIGGVQKFYWYSEGYLRTASEIYNLTDLDDPFIHLTNDAIQSTGDNYGKFEKGNKVTYSQFQRYLDINYPREKYSVPTLVQKMKSISREVVEATYFKLDPCRKQYSFELFGLDFLVDTNFNPWLLEVNTNPCLELSSPVLERLIPRMIQNLFRLVVDPIFQPFEAQMPRNLACYIPDNIIESNRFELIFDSLHDRNIEWEQYSANQNSNKVYEDENEQFQNDGEIIKIED